MLTSDKPLQRACELITGMTVYANLADLASAVSPYSFAYEARQICKENWGYLLEEIWAKLPLAFREADPMVDDEGELVIASLGRMEELDFTNFDWSDAEPIDFCVLSIPLFARFAASSISCRVSGQDRFLMTRDVRVEAWADVRVSLEGEGALEEVDFRITSVHLERDA